MIYAALGLKEQARGSLGRALALNPHFQPILDQVAAREYASLGGELKTPKRIYQFGRS